MYSSIYTDTAELRAPFCFSSWNAMMATNIPATDVGPRVVTNYSS
jgi:hypothetical protein